MRASILLPVLMLAACAKPAPAPTNAQTAAPEDTVIVPDDETVPADDGATRDLTGRWTGVEGMYLVVAKGAAPGRYKLTMQWDLDHQGSFDGVAEGDAIAFIRAGVRETLKPTDGDATGLKYLAGKQDCLTVKPGEGYCRDRQSR